MWQRFTEGARKAIFYAQEEAQRFGEGYISTEHLLLGLLRNPEDSGPQVLETLGVSLDRVRAEVERQLPRGDSRPSADMTLTPRAKRVIDLSYDEARNLNHDYIGTEHILLGLIRESDGVAGRVLAHLGVELLASRAAIGVSPPQGATEKQVRVRPLTRVSPSVPAWLTIARIFFPDTLAIMLLSQPSDDLIAACEKMDQDPLELSMVIERWMVTGGTTAVAELPSVSEFLDAGGGTVAIFGRIAKHPETLTHCALLEAGVTEEQIAAAFPD